MYVQRSAHCVTASTFGRRLPVLWAQTFKAAIRLPLSRRGRSTTTLRSKSSLQVPQRQTGSIRSAPRRERLLRGSGTRAQRPVLGTGVAVCPDPVSHGPPKQWLPTEANTTTSDARGAATVPTMSRSGAGTIGPVTTGPGQRLAPPGFHGAAQGDGRVPRGGSAT